MRKVARITADSLSAVMLLDGGTAVQYTDAILYSLAVAIDPGGKTQIASDFPDEDWKAIWMEQARPIWQMCDCEQLVLNLIPSGDFFLAVDDSVGSLPAGATVAESFDGLLALRSGELLVVGAQSISLQEDQYGGVLYDFSPGVYRVRIEHLCYPALVNYVDGEYWSEECPAIFIRLIGESQKSLDRESRNSALMPKNLYTLDVGKLRQIMAPSMFRNAIVLRIEGGSAILEILVSPNVRRGFAEVALEEHTVRKGQRVLIRLIEKVGGRWKAELRSKL